MSQTLNQRVILDSVKVGQHIDQRVREHSSECYYDSRSKQESGVIVALCFAGCVAVLFVAAVAKGFMWLLDLAFMAAGVGR